MGWRSGQATSGRIIGAADFFQEKNRNFQFDRSATDHYDPPDVF
jgi:hypothetical protein